MKNPADRKPDDWLESTPALDPNLRAGTDPLAPRVQRLAPRRPTRVLGWLVALGAGAAIAALGFIVSQDPRSVGKQLDDSVASVRDVGNRAGQTLNDSQDAAAQVSLGAVEGVGTAIDDAAISTKVKAALAVDPSLSAARIIVSTDKGIVRLEGPAPDAASRDRATVLAGAPQGVRGVDNRLALPQPANVVAVAEGASQPR